MILRKILLYFLFFFCLKGISQQQSVLATGTWYKFSVDKTGVFKIDLNLLNQIGINTSGLDPRKIKIYGNGGVMLPQLNSDFRYVDLQENRIYVEGEDDGVFDSDDYILFYAKGPDDWITDSESEIEHRKNIYSEKAYYFISVDNNSDNGKRILTAGTVYPSAVEQITTYKDYLFFEEEKNNLRRIGQQWFGDKFGLTNVRSYNFDFENIDTTKPLTVKVRGLSVSSTSSSMNVEVNQETLFTMDYIVPSNSSKALYKDKLVSSDVQLTSPSVNVEITYDQNGNPSAEGYLDYIEIIGDKILFANGSQFSFRNFKSQTTSGGSVLGYTVSNVSNIDMIWEVTDHLNPSSLTDLNTEDQDFTFKAYSGELKEYVVLNDSDYYVPEVLSNNPIENQNLHDFSNIEYLIVTSKDLLEQAQRLAGHHITQGMSVAVVDIEEIYNEFGSGSADITAIRDFVKFLYDNASSEENKIKYLCLFGDATYDYKNITPGNKNIVPVYLAYESFDMAASYVTDDYYGMMDSNEGLMTVSDKQDVATGRVVASNEDEAKNVVDKILGYYDKNSLGSWRNELTVMSDDLDDGEQILETTMELIADLIKENKPQYNIKKLYADAFKQEESSVGERYPDVNAALSNAVESGTLLINYFGHGGEKVLAAERLLEIPEIQSWNNFNKLPLFITITCDFTRFDDKSNNPISAGEEMILSKNGGAVNLISTAREIYINYGSSFNKSLIKKILDFDNNDYSIAQALMHTKNENPSASLNQHFFMFSFGDPAMKLGFPKPNINLTKINDKDITQERDTLKALSKIKLEGTITDVNNNLLSDFNGTLTVSIFDKEIEKSTLDNDNKNFVMHFDVQDSKVFKGKTEVENGTFEIEFIVPKDIKLAYGKAKISLYAENQAISKAGFDLETVIGGVNEVTDTDTDTEGPVISLFMNDESFQDGGITNVSPNLIAKFSDSSGVNTSLAGIGHTIKAVLDGDESNPIQLNEFYETDLGSYTSGSLTNTLRNLEPGEHSVTVTAWDTYNNSSRKTLNFTVVDDSSFVLENVLNYPNPFINYTEFWFNHNKPNEDLDITISIFTVSGQLVKSIHQSVSATGSSLSRSLSWDGRDDFGQKVGKGVYVYQLVVKSLDFTAEKFEKLVLLQ